MIRTRPLLAAAAALPLLAAAALAQEAKRDAAPLQLQRAAPPVPVAAKGGGKPVALDGSQREALAKVNASLNAVSVMTGDFVQVSGSGRRSEGKLYVSKPGRLRFEYNAPSPIEIVADGSSVVVRDRRLNTQDLYAIGQTPLKFLLRERIELGRDVPVVNFDSDPALVTVTIEDRSTIGGASRVALLFDAQTYALKQWTVTDPQGRDTMVAIRNVDTTRRPDPALFRISYERLIEDKK